VRFKVKNDFDKVCTIETLAKLKKWLVKIKNKQKIIFKVDNKNERSKEVKKLK
jgi:hypothetical protein